MNERGGAAAAIQALTAIAKLSGKWIEKSETTTRTDDLNQLSDAKLAAIPDSFLRLADEVLAHSGHPKLHRICPLL